MEKLSQMTVYALQKRRGRTLVMLLITNILLVLTAILVNYSIIANTVFAIFIMVVIVLFILYYGLLHLYCSNLIRQKIMSELYRRMGFDNWLKTTVKDIFILTKEERDLYYQKWLDLVKEL